MSYKGGRNKMSKEIKDPQVFKSLKPLSPPITEKGVSALVPQGPWCYAMEFVAVHFLTNTSDLKSIIPKQLTPTGDVWAYVSSIVAVSKSWPEFYIEAPDLSQYMEAALFTKVNFNGKSYAYCPFMYVDKDLPLMRGYIVGFPKKIAKISITTFHKMLPGYEKPREGVVLSGFAIRSSYPLLKIRLKLERPCEKLPIEDFGPFLLPRYFPQLTSEVGGFARLVSLESIVKYGDKWEGSANIELIGGINDELGSIPIKKVLRGYYYQCYLEIDAKSVKSVAELII